jgi:hypothetical protein
VHLVKPAACPAAAAYPAAAYNVPGDLAPGGMPMTAPMLFEIFTDYV